MLGFKIKNKINQTILVGFISVGYQYRNLSHHFILIKNTPKKEHAGGMFFLSFMRGLDLEVVTHA